MPKYEICFSLELHGETIIEANDIREAIEILDQKYFPKITIKELSTSPFSIDAVFQKDLEVVQPNQ